MKVVRLPQALTDLIETADFIAENSIEAADRFFEAFESAVKTIRRNPKIGSPRMFEERIEVRMWPIKGFEKCLIFYTATNEEIVILRVIHSARDYSRLF